MGCIPSRGLGRILESYNGRPPRFSSAGCLFRLQKTVLDFIKLLAGRLTTWYYSAESSVSSSVKAETRGSWTHIQNCSCIQSKQAKLTKAVAHLTTIIGRWTLIFSASYGYLKIARHMEQDMVIYVDRFDPECARFLLKKLTDDQQNAVRLRFASFLIFYFPY